MKKLAIFTILTAFVLTTGLLEEIRAQTKKTPNNVADSKKFEAAPLWKVYFEVTVKGEGTKAGTGGSFSAWSIDRKYSGFLLLNHKITMPKFELPPTATNMMTAEQLHQYQNQMSAMGSVRWDNLAQGDNEILRDIHVNINDKSKVVDRSPGEAGSWQQTTTDQTWFCDSHTKAVKFTHFLADTKNLTFTVNIPIYPMNQDKLIKNQGIVKYEASGNITLEPPKTIDEDLPFSKAPPPSVKGLIEGGSIIYKSPPGGLNTDFDTWEFTTLEMQPDQPLPGFPDSKNKVWIKVYFKFSKTNLDNKAG